MQSINESFDYINASSVFINEAFDYKNKTCIFINGTCVYRLVLSNWYFGTNPKEVCKGIRVTFLLIDYGIDSVLYPLCSYFK